MDATESKILTWRSSTGSCEKLMKKTKQAKRPCEAAVTMRQEKGSCSVQPVRASDHVSLAEFPGRVPGPSHEDLQNADQGFWATLGLAHPRKGRPRPQAVNRLAFQPPLSLHSFATLSQAHRLASA